MDIKITAKNIKLTPAIKEFINARVGKIENFFDNIVSAQVLISVEKKINQRAEIIVHTGAKTTLTASAVESNLYKAIDAAAIKVEGQAKKVKSKAKARKITKKSAKEVAELNPFAEHMMISQNDVKFSVIKQVEVSPMNPEDAAYEMERLGYSFWMFLDEDSKQINLIFKRLDGTYGLIKPIKKK